MPKYQDFLRQQIPAIFKVLIEPNITVTQEDFEEYNYEP
jgi:hypothetical protein